MTVWDLFIILTGFLVILTIGGALAALLARREANRARYQQARRIGRPGASCGPTRGPGR